MEKSIEEQQIGLLGEVHTKTQLDNRTGKGRWRAIRRCAILQGDKARRIDNCTASRHNDGAWVRETISTVPHDIGAKILQWAVRSGTTIVADLAASLPSLGSDDLEAACKRCTQ